MNWTWQKILGFGITALLVMTLIFAPATGIISKITTSHTNANQRVDDTNAAIAKP